MKKIMLVFLVFIMIISVMPFLTYGSTQKTVYIVPTDDTFISSSYEGGLGHYINVQLDFVGTLRMLFKYDISVIPSGSSIIEANINLYLYSKSGGGEGSTLTQAYWISDDSWDEHTVTWNTAPSYSTAMGQYNLYGTDTDIFIKWDVATKLQDEVNGTNQYYSVLIKMVSETASRNYRFFSKEYSSSYTYLKVTYFEPSVFVDSVTLLNPSIGAKGILAEYKDYEFRVIITDDYGLTDVESVYLTIAYQQAYNIILKWDRATDTFSEESDVNNLFILGETGGSSSYENTWTLDFEGKFSFDYPTNEFEDINVEIYSTLDISDFFIDFYYVETRYSITGHITPEAVEPDKDVAIWGNVYYWFTEITALTGATVTIKLDGVTKGTPTIDQYGYFESSFTAPSIIGVYGYKLTTPQSPQELLVQLIVVRPTTVISSGSGTGTYGWSDNDIGRPWAGISGVPTDSTATSTYTISRFQMFHTRIEVNWDTVQQDMLIMLKLKKNASTVFECSLLVKLGILDTRLELEWQYHNYTTDWETIKSVMFDYTDGSNDNTHEFIIDAWITIDDQYVQFRFTNAEDTPSTTESWNYAFRLANKTVNEVSYSFFDTISEVLMIVRTRELVGIVNIISQSEINMQNNEMKGINAPVIILPVERVNWGWLEPLRQAFIGLGTTFYIALRPLFDFLGSAIGGIATALGTILAPVFATLTDVFSGLANSIAMALFGLVTVTIDLIDGVIETIFGLSPDANPFSSFIVGIVYWIGQIGNFVNWIAVQVPIFITMLFSMITGLGTFFSNLFSTLSYTFTNAGGNIFSTFSGFFTGMGDLWNGTGMFEGGLAMKDWFYLGLIIVPLFIIGQVLAEGSFAPMWHYLGIAQTVLGLLFNLVMFGFEMLRKIIEIIMRFIPFF